MDNDQYIPYSAVRKSYAVSNATLKKWDAAGIVDTIRLPGGKRLYSTRGIHKCFNVPQKPRTKYIYARVSSSHQKPDLDRQVESLQHDYPSHTVITDVGSGLNWKRKGFTSLLDLIHAGDCEEIVVAYRDRLCRFGYELVEWIAQKHNCRIVVHTQGLDVQQDTFGDAELAEDLLAVVTFFTAKNNGLRAAKNKRRRKESKEDSVTINDTTEVVAQQVV